MGKRQKNLGDRSWKKKKRNLAENYQESVQQNYYTDRGKEDTKERERRDGMKIGVDRKIPQDEKS